MTGCVFGCLVGGDLPTVTPAGSAARDAAGSAARDAAGSAARTPAE